MRSIRKKTARWAVFAAVGNERSEAIAAAAAENPFRRTKNTRVVFTALVFLLYLGCRDSNTSVQKSSSLSADFWENSPVDCSILSDEPFRRTKNLRYFCCLRFLLSERVGTIRLTDKL